MLFPHKNKKTCRKDCIQTTGFLNKERNFDGESVLCTEEMLFPHLLYILYQIFRRAQIFVGFFISSSFIAYINNESKCTACRFVLCFAYLYLIRFFVQKKTALPSYLPFLLDKWSRIPTIPTIAVYARMAMAFLIKNHLFIHTPAIKIATMAITIINAAIFMATAIINDAIFLKKFFIFSSLSLFNTTVFFNCKNFVSNLICHFPTKTKTPPQGLHPSDRIF